MENPRKTTNIDVMDNQAPHVVLGRDRVADSHPVKVVAPEALPDAHPIDFHALGLAGVVDRLAERIRGTGLNVELEVLHTDAEIDRRTAMLLYRATDELFRNILARAAATEVKVRLQAASQGIQVCIQHDGIGVHDELMLSAEPMEGGLRNLLHVVGLGGGYIRVESNPEATSITIKLPLH